MFCVTFGVLHVCAVSVDGLAIAVDLHSPLRKDRVAASILQAGLEVFIAAYK